MKQPKQYTSVLMLPVNPTRASELAASSSWLSVGTVAIELLIGVAAVSDERRRQRTALAAVRSIFMHTQEGEVALQNFVASIYEKREASK